MDPAAAILSEFRASVQRPARLIDLVDSALLAAGCEYPGLDRSQYRRKLVDMGLTAGERCRGTTLERLDALNEIVYEELGFHGNTDSYYDPRNSFLNEVIDRRTGIPITLALVYIEIAKGAGLDLCGIGLPGHFLVGIRGTGTGPGGAGVAAAGPFIDVFSRGRRLTREDCLQMYETSHPDGEFRPEFLSAVGPRPFLSRLLNNLFGVYLNAGEFAKAAPVVEMMMAVNANDAELLRRRVLVARELGRYGQAFQDLQQYIALRPEAPDMLALHQQLELLSRLRQTIH